MASSLDKEDYFIRKFDGTNFSIWKERSVGSFGCKRSHYDTLTSLLHLAESVFFTIIGKTTAKDLWDSLCSAWESKSTSNKVFLVNKLMKLSMKEGSIVFGHLNEFNSLFSQLTSGSFSEFDDELESIFVLCSLPSSWDKFCTVISNSAPNGKLVFNDVTNALLLEEIQCKSLEGASHGDAYMASSSQKQRGHDKYKNRSKSRERNPRSQSRNRNSSKERSAKNVECYYCHKKGHYKKDCRNFLRNQKDKQKDKSDKGKSSVKIEEIKVVESTMASIAVGNVPTPVMHIMPALIHAQIKHFCLSPFLAFWAALSVHNMSSRRPRGSKGSRWDKEESSRDHALPAEEHQVLGLPLARRDLVEKVVPGVFLFLFDIDSRELHGVFEASSHGGLNLEPKAFQGQGSYPAQVRFAIYRECLPLPENVFKAVIEENYFARSKFHPELTSDQVSRLVQSFRPIEAPRKRLLVDGAMQEAGGHRLERVIPVPGGLELANRIPQYRLPAPGMRLEERLPRQDPRALAAEVVERPPLPQLRVLDGRSEQKDLLSQGRLEEVDQLALKYLQPGNPAARIALNPLQRNAAVEAARAVPSQEAIFRSRSLELDRLRAAAGQAAFLREQGSSLPGVGSSRAGVPFAAIRHEPVAVSGLARQSADIRRRR
ncbi:hypothetical protein L7F22_055279 [Adiantum nelumboides]|nr:hypothetical protein [Adiantum nelumboides]